MRRFVISLSLAFVVLLGLVAVGQSIRAQEATPAASPYFIVGQLAPFGERFELLPGVEVEFLGHRA